jgi:hypothetical protein
MRLWSLHPKYLDAKGLVAVWREGLLAQKTLLVRTKGYRNHPQLKRFRAETDPDLAIGAYLAAIEQEAQQRGYHFDASRIIKNGNPPRIAVREGQLRYEWNHLLEKLRIRNPDVFTKNKPVTTPDAHPLFYSIPGEVEEWEKIHGNA